MKALIAHIVEEELHAPLISHETNEEFITRVSIICLNDITDANTILPQGFTLDVLKEIEFEVTEILRKKIYGHYNLNSFRQNFIRSRVL